MSFELVLIDFRIKFRLICDCTLIAFGLFFVFFCVYLFINNSIILNIKTMKKGEKNYIGSIMVLFAVTVISLMIISVHSTLTGNKEIINFIMNF